MRLFERHKSTGKGATALGVSGLVSAVLLALGVPAEYHAYIIPVVLALLEVGRNWIKHNSGLDQL